MNLNQTKQTLERWINSCTSVGQLSLCLDIIREFIGERFKEEFETSLVVEELKDLVRDREKIIVKMVFQEG